MREKAVLVTAFFDSIPRQSRLEDVALELEELARSTSLAVLESFAFRQKEPSPALYIGKGKAEEIRRAAVAKKADVVVFDGNLSSSQQRNLEEALGVKTLDRTQLILDIFASRAKSTEGKLQVELAQLKYLLPKLAGKGIYLSRLGGGVGTRGPGEQKLETDRRLIRARISRLGGELEKLEERRLSGIRRKKDRNFPMVALVGYTNAGKSSLFNALTRSGTLVKDKLFSTLDTTTRSLELPGNQKALLSDTVGFIRDLPHHLIESFKATLEETLHADLLLHVIDASRPDWVLLKKTVEKVLEGLGVEGRQVLYVLNKKDLLPEGAFSAPQGIEKVAVSALTGEGLKDLRDRIAAILSVSREEKIFFIPKGKEALVHYLYENAHVLGRKDEAQGSYLTVRIHPDTESVFKNRLAGS